MPPDIPVGLGAATLDYEHAVAAQAAHERDTGWNEDCADCASLQAHVDRTRHQLALLGPPATEEVTLW